MVRVLGMLALIAGLLVMDVIRGEAAASRMLVVVPQASKTPAVSIAVERLKTYGSSEVDVVYGSAQGRGTDAGLVVILGTRQSPKLSSAVEDSYVVETVSKSPLTVVASGTNERSMLYAAYRLADMLKAKAELADLDLFYQPKVEHRLVSFGATTHGRRVYNPELYWKTLSELPRFGYNGVVIYPGGGTPIGRHASPVVEGKDGSLSLEPENTKQWKEWLAKVDAYGFDIMMTVPPIVPPGYEKKAIRDYYAGGLEPKDYLESLRKHFRQYLELLTKAYPEADMYMFNSTEGATFGRNERFFGGPDLKRFSNEDYLRNNEAIMATYFEVLQEFFREDIRKICFWTHSYGLTSDGIRKMREVLFRYPKVTIIEDDFWNNSVWPFDLPAMAYLPDDLRERVSKQNPFAMFQIATDGEYFGGGSLPNAYPGSHIRSANEALDRKARMVIQRMDLHDRTPYGTAFGTMEIVPLAASRQLWEPTQDESEIWKEWAERRFGKDAAPFVIKALQESRTVILKGLGCRGVDMLAVGSEFKPASWKPSQSGVSRFHLFGKPGKRFVEDDARVILSSQYQAYQMKTESIPIGEFRKNQEEAMEAVLRGLAEIENARPHLMQADYEMLKGIYDNGTNVLRAMRLLGETAYAANLVLSNFDNVKDPRALFNESAANLQKYLKEGKLIPEMTENLQEILKSYRKDVEESATAFPDIADLPSRPELPDPLRMLDGTPVTTPEVWYKYRRPELKALFEHYVYGCAPPPPGIVATVSKIDRNVFGGKATLKEVDIRFRNALHKDAPRIRLALFLPNRVKGRVPVFLITNRNGNHDVSNCPSITIDEAAWSPPKSVLPKEAGRGASADFYCVEYVIDRGYAFATFYPGDLAPDDKEFAGGIFDCYKDLPGPKETHWGTIRAWAWGIHRVVDYLATDVRVDRSRICVTGHSRRGKTALLAAALDERIALCVPHQSGTGGCALSRNNKVETIELLNRVQPHWFNDVFPQFGGKEDRLPVDQHLLIALVAPRPLLDTEGKQDRGANRDSALKAVQAADPVYKLLGADGIKGSGLTQDDEDVAGEDVGNLVQHRLDTIHTLNRDYWKVMLDFADKQLVR